MTILTRIRKSGLCRIPVSFLAIFLLILPPGIMPAQSPGWWQSRGVLKAGAPADDYAVINQGQLKNLARAAVQEMNSLPSVGAGKELEDLVASWATPTAQTDDYAAVNNGQLKALAQIVYNRLFVIGFASSYPWAGSSRQQDDYALANIGQAKNLFAFDLRKDTDGDGIPDWWELKVGLNPSDPTDADTDVGGNGTTAAQDYSAGVDPTNPNPGGDQSVQSARAIGDAPPGVRISKKKTVTLPAGGQTYIVIVAVKTDEYPDWTSKQSEWNDVADWKISPAGGTAIQGSVNVNALHSAFAQSEQAGTNFMGLAPFAIAATGTVRANPSTPTQVQIEVGATNISDGLLPTTVVAALLPVEMRITDRDDPKKKWTDNVVKTAPVYSGKSTGDMVSWKFGGTDSWTNATFSWSAEGPETKTGPSGIGKNEWKIADGDADTDHDWIDWKPGKYTIKCVINSGGVSSTVEFKQEVGVRTDDVVVVGWIDPARVTLNTSGVQGALMQVLPPGGLASASSNAKSLAAVLFKYISEDGVASNFTIYVPIAIRDSVNDPSNILARFYDFGSEDKTYTLNWMFKYSGNTPPPNSFTDTNGYFDQQLLDNFVNQHDSTDFKLMNHYQAKYRMNEYGKFIIEPGKTRLGELKARALIGNTKDPSHFYDVIGGWPDAFLRTLGYPPGGVFPGQSSDRNTQFSIGNTGLTTTQLLNEGRPDQKALDAFFKLTGHGQGYIWSSITFFSDLKFYSDTNSPSTPTTSLTRDPRPQEFSAPRINTQVYPTFWIYINGKKTSPAQNQDPNPSALFPNTDRAQ